MRNGEDSKIQLGLTSKEAQRLLFEEGENTLQKKKRIHPLKIFVAQFRDIMIMILLLSTVISAVMGEYTEAFTIIAIVFVNAVLGFAQEYKTEKTLDKLKDMSSPTAEVIRDGKEMTVDTRELVRGDLILLKAGDRVPADAFVVENVSLYADESIITGESLPVSKREWDRVDRTPAAGRKDMVYMGSTISKGRGRAVVASTGMNSEMGKIAGMLNEIEQEITPLQKKLDQLGKYIGIGCLGICAIVSLTGILRGEPVFDMFLTGISLSVAAIPEGLPAIVTITLALAMGRILKRNALIRKLHAVETLGCANVICSDKTGTLTENRMAVREISCVERDYEVQQEITAPGNRNVNILQNCSLKMLLNIAVLCNNATLEEEEPGRIGKLLGASRSEGRLIGEPTECALLSMAYKAKVTARLLDREYTRLSEIPFDSERKRMSVEIRDNMGKRTLLTKGAPDVILDRCTHCLTDTGVQLLTPAGREEILHSNEQMASKAMRVLGFAYRELGTTPLTGDPEQGLVFVGLCGMIDPPRPEVFDAVLKCKRAGIRPVMITGDHKATACAIAKELKILAPGDLVLTGKEIDAMSDVEFESKVAKTTVFARVNPSHKLRIVRSLKRRGNVVAMTGDGVNDAPAVKEADIGVSMGITGTDVTKEAASLILLDDNFASLVAAVEEGRVIYKNIRKSIRYLLSCNIGEVLTMFVGMLMGMPVVLLPIQILLVNLVTDGLPAIALGLEPPEDNIMNQKPRDAGDSIFSGGLIGIILFRGCLIGLTTLAVFSTLFRQGNLELARTGALLTLVITQLFYVFECKSEEKSLFHIPLLNNLKLLLAALFSAVVMGLVLYLPLLQFIFKTVPLQPKDLIVVFAYSLAAPLLSSIITYFKNKPRQQK